MSRILVVEDEAHIAQGLLFNLEAEGHQVTAVDTGEAALHLILDQHEQFDAIVLDVMLPGISGFEVSSTLRAAENFVPILMLTARSRQEDVLKGFECGTDDYLSKPFELSILLARVRSLLRRTAWMQAARTNNGMPVAHEYDTHEVFRFSGKTVDFDNLLFTTERGQFHLTLMEADLLRYLIRHSGRSVSRKQILDEVWQLREDTDTRAIDNFIVRLRRYIEDEPSHPVHLVTVRGIGYRFVPEPKEN